jgi:hypothetical protein
MHKAVLAATVAALTATVAIPALSDAQDAAARDITVHEKVLGVTFVQQKKSTGEDRLAPGDRVLTRQALSNDAGRRIGTLSTDCVNVGGRTAPVFSATLQCTSTYALRDGQIVAAGVVRLDRPGAAGLPIAGGSGAYRTARGEVTAGTPSKPRETVAILHVRD